MESPRKFESKLPYLHFGNYFHNQIILKHDFSGIQYPITKLSEYFSKARINTPSAFDYKG